MCVCHVPWCEFCVHCYNYGCDVIHCYIIDNNTLLKQPAGKLLSYEDLLVLSLLYNASLHTVSSFVEYSIHLHM